MFGTLVMRVSYGFDDIRKNEALVHKAEAFLSGLTQALSPGRFLVNSIPALRHVPSWFPGAGFKRYLSAVAQIGLQAVNLPFEEAKQDHVSSSS